jgi:hypothetical protein
VSNNRFCVGHPLSPQCTLEEADPSLSTLIGFGVEAESGAVSRASQPHEKILSYHVYHSNFSNFIVYRDLFVIT